MGEEALGKAKPRRLATGTELVYSADTALAFYAIRSSDWAAAAA